MILGVLLFVIGAILHWAVTLHSSAVDWNTVGIILMWAGGILFVVDLFLGYLWAGWPWYRRRS